jgi:hypothetical protein
MKFITEDTKAKHTIITTIYRDNLNVLTKVIKTPSRKAWVQKPSDLIKSGRKHKRF